MQSLATALKLSAAERQHLFWLAGQPSEIVVPEEEVSPILQHILDKLDPGPAYVMGKRWDYLAWNKAAEEVFLPQRSQGPYAQNILWRIFTEPGRQLYRERWEQRARVILAEFRSETARYADEDWFQQFIVDIQEASPDFRNWWPQYDVRTRSEGHKEIIHPVMGSLWFEHTTLQIPANPDLKVMIYTPLAGTDTAAKLRQIREAQTKSPISSNGQYQLTLTGEQLAVASMQE